MNKQIGNAILHIGWDWTILMVGLTWERAIRREDGSKHTSTEFYISLGPLHIGVYW